MKQGLRTKLVALVLKKILRDLRQGWLSFGACICMLALSVSLFLAFYSAAFSLELSTESTYEKLKFLDFTLFVNQTSNSNVARIASIPGVKAVSGRASHPSRILLDPISVRASNSRSVEGRLIGVPVAERAPVNDVYVEEGRYLAQERGEALVERRFATHHNIKVGDLIRVEVNSDERRYRVVGLVSSPEYVWMATNRFDPRPIEKRYGVVFVSEKDAFSTTGGAYIDEIHVTVKDPEQRDRIVNEAKDRLRADLQSPPLLREEQPSHALVLRDRRAFRGLAIFFPIVFLSLSSITIFSTLWQLLSRQRRQIGILMCQGCSTGQLLGQYLLIGLVIGCLGTSLGVTVGLPLGYACTRFYAGILHLPFVQTQIPLLPTALLCLVSVALSVVATWLATRRVLDLDPIRALRMEFKEGWVPRRQLALERLLPTSLRFALRNLARNPGRTFLATLGVATSVAQIVMTLAVYDSQNRTLNYYFESVHQYDFEVSLKRVLGATSLPHVGSWPEVEAVDTCLRRSAVLHFQDRQLDVNVWGVAPEGKLLRLFDEKDHLVKVNREPLIYLGPVQLARLGARPGDRITVTLERHHPDPPEFDFVIGQVLHEPLAHPPKLALAQLQRMTHKSEWMVADGVNILLVRARPGMRDALEKRLLNDQNVAGIFSPEQAKEEVQDLLRMFNAYKTLILAFTSLFAIVVLLGTTTMTLMERTREFATLSCLGVSDWKLAKLLLTETLMVWFLGLLLGLPAGLALGSQMMNSFQRQLLSLDLSLSPETVVVTALVSLLICILALVNGILRLRSLPLTAATQDRFE